MLLIEAMILETAGVVSNLLCMIHRKNLCSPNVILLIAGCSGRYISLFRETLKTYSRWAVNSSSFYLRTDSLSLSTKLHWKSLEHVHSFCRWLFLQNGEVSSTNGVRLASCSLGSRIVHRQAEKSRSKT